MRILIPLIALLLGVAVAVGVLRNTKPDPSAPPATPAAAGDAPTAPQASDGSPDREPSPSATSQTPDDSAATPAPARPDTTETTDTTPHAVAEPIPTPSQWSAPVEAPGTLRVLPADAPRGVTLGGLDPDGPFRIELTLTSYGAGIRKLQLADYAQRIEGDGRYTLIDPTKGRETASFYPLAARTLTLGKTAVPLSAVAWVADEPVRSAEAQSVTYRAAVVDDAGDTLGVLTRTWTVKADSYDIRLAQRFENRSDRSLEAVFEQYGVGDILMDEGAYVGDRRQFVTGYFRPQYDPSRVNIYTQDAIWLRSDFLKASPKPFWPNASLKADAEYAWVAVENRYFAMVAHLPVAAAPAQGDTLTPRDVPAMQARFPELRTRTFHLGADGKEADVITTLGTATLRIEPGASEDLSLNVFAGPRKKELLTQQPYAAMRLEQLIRYELGCTWCTFQFLAHWLLDYLKFLHHWIVYDWGVAIVVLVITVRLLLHPITKRAQTNMMKMSKQMAAIQPDMQKLKEKYKDDPAKMNQEVMKLYREKGVNPAGFLGCLPMLLQTPIWIALYAMLYYAIELRHQPAFYGVFQAVSSGSWKFLADLSVADHFIKFPGDGFKLNLLFVHPTFAAINVLPILMAVVFYINMKFTTPPPATEEQRQQQRIMKIMPVIFPVFLYSAPSGLTLYICASTLAGIFDSYIVRRHIREQEEAGTLFDKKQAKPGSLKWKLQQRVKMASEMAAARMQEQQKRKKVDNTAAPRSYKDRKKK